MLCYNCSKNCEEEVYKVKIIDEHGNKREEETCSISCADSLKNKYANLHQQRVNDIMYQTYQRLF